MSITERKNVDWMRIVDFKVGDCSLDKRYQLVTIAENRQQIVRLVTRMDVPQNPECKGVGIY